MQVQQTAQLQAQVAAKDKFIVTLRETLTSAGDQGSQNSLTAQGGHASFEHILSDWSHKPQSVLQRANTGCTKVCQDSLTSHEQVFQQAVCPSCINKFHVGDG